MKRFEYEDDYDDDFDLDEDNELDEEEYTEFVNTFQLNLVQYELNQTLLANVITFLEKSWFWKFKSVETKLKLIEQTYNKFKVLTEKKEEDADI